MLQLLGGTLGLLQAPYRFSQGPFAFILEFCGRRLSNVVCVCVSKQPTDYMNEWMNECGRA